MAEQNSPTVRIFYDVDANNLKLEFGEVDSQTTYGEKVPVARLTVWMSGIDPLVAELDRDRATQLGYALLEGFPERKEAWVNDPSLPEENTAAVAKPIELNRTEIVEAFRAALQTGNAAALAELAGIYPFLRQEPSS